MYYVERKVKPPLDQAVAFLWYTRTPQLPHGFERVLPTGRVQVIINLARDHIWQCGADGRERTVGPSLVVGGRSACEIIDTSDLSDLAGIVFLPGGFRSFVPASADCFSNTSAALEDVWGGKALQLRDRLLEAPTPEAKLCGMENFLLENFGGSISRNDIVAHALDRFSQRQCTVASVAEIASEVGLSNRHFSQVFREHVGFSPKVWCRIQRFQKAVQQLHQGSEIRWASLAVDCGYYDQSHFANEFHTFSGIDATTYKAGSGPWANHRAIG